MDRRKAIDWLVSESFTACQNFCCGSCTCGEDTREALRTLGVTQEELDAE
jgi:hypothetical protein